MIDRTIEIRSCVKTSSFFSCEKHFSSFFRRNKKHSLVKLRIIFFTGVEMIYSRVKLSEAILFHVWNWVKIQKIQKKKFSENDGVFAGEEKLTCETYFFSSFFRRKKKKIMRETDKKNLRKTFLYFNVRKLRGKNNKVWNFVKLFFVSHMRFDLLPSLFNS